MINVTQPFLPPYEEYASYLKGIWDRKWLTNNGPLVNDLELKLKEYLDLKHLLFLGNGTIALQIAIKALGLKGKIITTPFSYVATTSSIVWEGCEPVFSDIDPMTFNIDPQKIEPLLTNDTVAILATHVFGNPCDIESIHSIASRHGLKVIYDAAHCFGSTYRQSSVLNFGDISTISFHATKLFHTVEGGAIVTSDASLLEKASLLRNFGHDGPTNFPEVGINGKNSEFHAGMGLANLKYMDEVLKNRKILSEYYDLRLNDLNVRRPLISEDCGYNYAYYPIVFPDEEKLIKSLNLLNSHKVFPRRYFYPSLNTISYTMGKYSTPISEDISKRVLCLPLYHQLDKEEIDLICRLLLRSKNYEW